MEGRKGKPPKKSGSRKKSHKYSHAGIRECFSDEQYCFTDEDDSGFQKSHRYSCTSFPLFSNLSDDEVILSHQKPSQKTCMKVSHSAPSGRSLRQEVDGIDSEENDVSQVFPFEYLPVHCKFKVFSYLTSCQKGVGFFVSRDWQHMLLSPSLWTRVSFGDFPMSCIPSAQHDFRISCYACYKQRVYGFSHFLIRLRPVLKRLEFKFDIGDPLDGYLEMFQSIVGHMDLRELQYVFFNWKETPARPFWREKRSCEDVVFNHRHRARKFVNVFDTFTKVSPKITTLVMPFHWLSKSVNCLTRLKNLHSLVLERYFYSVLQQKLIDKLLNGLPNLKRLLLEVWTPSGPSLVLFRMSSASLEYLDISQSRGFYLEALNMPRLRCFRVSRHPWSGPLVSPESRILPCLYNILTSGAPKLTKVNDHYLEPGWRNFCYPTLDEVLKSVCACKRHKTEWAV